MLGVGSAVVGFVNTGEAIPKSQAEVHLLKEEKEEGTSRPSSSRSVTSEESARRCPSGHPFLPAKFSATQVLWHMWTKQKQEVLVYFENLKYKFCPTVVGLAEEPPPHQGAHGHLALGVAYWSHFSSIIETESRLAPRPWKAPQEFEDSACHL